MFKLKFSPDGKNLLAASGDKIVHIFDAKGSGQRKLQGHNDWVYSIAVSLDSKTVASGSWDGEVKLWNLADGKLSEDDNRRARLQTGRCQNGSEVK